MSNVKPKLYKSKICIHNHSALISVIVCFIIAHFLIPNGNSITK